MGNNASKPTKPDSERAEWENQHSIRPLHRSTSKRRKTFDIVRLTDERESDLSVAEKENHTSIDLVRNHSDASVLIQNNASTRGRNHLDNLFPDQTADKSDKEQSGVRRKSKKDYSTANENKTQTESIEILSVDEKQNNQLIASKMNGIVQPVASNVDMHQPMAAFSAIQAPEAKCSKHRSYSDKREDGNSAWTPIAGAFYEDAKTNINRHIDSSNPLEAAASSRLFNLLDNSFPDQTADKSDKEQSGVRRKSKKDYSTANENKTQTETIKVLSVDEKQNDQPIASEMNGIVKPIASNSNMHPPMSAFSAIQAPEAKYSKHRSHSDKREDGNGAWTPIVGAFYEDAKTHMNRHSDSSNLFEAAASSRLAKKTTSDCESRNNSLTKSSSELPEPSFMQQVSTVDSVLASNNSSPSVSFSTNNAVQSSPQTSHSLLFSNAGASSNSSLFLTSILTQPTATSSAYGNFSYSGNVLSSVTTSSNLPTMTNSTSVLPNDFSCGNFSMRSGSSATGRSSASVTPSNTYLDSLQTFKHFSSFTSQTNVSVGSSSNSSSTVTTNISAPRSSFYDYPETSSHTSITFDTNVSGSLSNMGNNNLRNSPDEIARNREENETEVEEDNMDLLYADGFAFQTNNSSHNDNRNKNNVDRDCIFIRTSVGDTITQISAKNITLNTTYLDNDLTDENMGIILERPKYPRYATLASRERSFQNVWPATNKMSWVKLPEAGFVYTGTADCVRCYYCNGGLREWLKNDCPWTEHARYYPHCPHVRQNKGDEFVRRVRNGTDDVAVAMDGGSGDEMDVDNRADIISLSRDQEAIKIAEEIISDRNLLEKAAYYIKNVQGKSSFDAQQLAAIAFEIEDGGIVFNFEDALEDDRSSIVDEVLTESDSFDSEDDLEVDGGVLEEENRMLRDRSLCKVCLDATACVLFLECGHMIACAMCAPALKTCAVCRAEVKGTVRAIYSTDR